MAERALIINTKIATADTVTKLYDSPSGGSGTVISALTVTNDSAASVSYKIYIVDSDGIVGDPIVPQTIVVKDRSSPAATAVNQTVPSGGSLRAENSTANALAFYMSGLEQA